jgi:thiol-disulfide isomerase/thioredoxin
MRWFRSAVLYTALALGANAAVAGSSLDGLLTGEMNKLVLAAPATVSAQAFTDRDGAEHHLADFAGKVTLVNFWATWCAPCRKEMPTLDALQGALGGDDFQVVPIAVGRNLLPALDRFFADAGVTRLPVYLDASQALARDMGVMGLPLTVILDAQGREIARMRGDADWNSPEAQALIRALIAG